MLRLDSRFTRVKAGGRSMNGHTSYWLGPDHLLTVTVGHFVEAYRRYYYADIAAVVVRRTPAHVWETGLCLFLLAVIGVPFGLSLREALERGAGESWAAAVALGVVVLAAAGYLAVGLFRGPTCLCYVHTAVQTRQLEGIRRLRDGGRLAAALEARVLAAQTAAAGAPPPEAEPELGAEGRDASPKPTRSP